MQLPENPKQSLGLIQRLLVLQVNVPKGKGFSIELAISDREKQKKRLHFSTVYKGLSVNLFHAKIPLTGLKNNWAMLFIDLESLAGELFKGISTLDAISLFASCQIRRIFTMKPAASADESSMAGSIPCSYQFPPDVHYTTCVLNMKNLQRGKISDQSKTTRTKGLSTVKPQHPAKEVHCSPTKESLVGSAVSIHLWENNYGPEVQFSLHEKVAMPPTHQIKQGLGQKEQKNEAGDDPVGIARGRRHEAILEKDFFGCDNDGDRVYATFQQPRAHLKSTPASPGSPTLDMEMKLQSEFHSPHQKTPQTLSPPSWGPFNRTQNPAVRPRARCLSPVLTFSKTQNKCSSDQSRTVTGTMRVNSGGSFSQGLRQEVKLNDPKQKVLDSEESDDLWKSSDSSSSDYLLLMQNLKLHEDKEELQMLASLRREQEEDEYGASSPSGLQIQECNISTSPGGPPWTPVSMSNVGLDDAGEVISLQSKTRHSETPTSLLLRERMDALRPSVNSPSQQRRSGNTQTSQENLIKAYRTIMEEKEKKKDEEELEEDEDEELEDEDDEEDDEEEEEDDCI